MEKNLEIWNLQVPVAEVDSDKTNLTKISTPMRFSECSSEVDYSTAVNNREDSVSSKQLNNKILEVVTHTIMDKEDNVRNKTRELCWGSFFLLFLSLLWASWPTSPSMVAQAHRMYINNKIKEWRITNFHSPKPTHTNMNYKPTTWTSRTS